MYDVHTLLMFAVSFLSTFFASFFLFFFFCACDGKQKNERTYVQCCTKVTRKKTTKYTHASSSHCHGFSLSFQQYFFSFFLSQATSCARHFRMLDAYYFSNKRRHNILFWNLCESLPFFRSSIETEIFAVSLLRHHENISTENITSWKCQKRIQYVSIWIIQKLNKSRKKNCRQWRIVTFPTCRAKGFFCMRWTRSLLIQNSIAVDIDVGGSDNDSVNNDSQQKANLATK